MKQFFGKYRGEVRANIDPLRRGRVQVSVPAVFGHGRLSWAEPCVPYAGRGVGFFAVPPVGTKVWVEFEAGDPRRPILAGCFWELGQVPGPSLPQVKVWQTDCVTITLSDLPQVGGLSIEVRPPAVASPMKISLSGSGIEVKNGLASISLDPKTVSINGGALEVT
ncbi:phage baseplate assembly protein V [Catellatospora chokoriensis]|uniref:Baseplate assembly protein n=1 Tax=Catellatospora chokoriensis TaxID=310353 RepID=A0A8J3K6J6_9ACTN|nr:phage baseplate assembly protein V [Catellatospora chokoriensis]GIF90379.1 baseplate assembly protein [Catellatospora chokoriensis]